MGKKLRIGEKPDKGATAPGQHHPDGRQPAAVDGAAAGAASTDPNAEDIHMSQKGTIIIVEQPTCATSRS